MSIVPGNIILRITVDTVDGELNPEFNQYVIIPGKLLEIFRYGNGR